MFKLPITEQIAFPDFRRNLGANTMDTIDIIDSMDKIVHFPGTVWTLWILLHYIDSYAQERLVAGCRCFAPQSAGPIKIHRRWFSVSQKCGAFGLKLALGEV